MLNQALPGVCRHGPSAAIYDSLRNDALNRESIRELVAVTPRQR